MRYISPRKTICVLDFKRLRFLVNGVLQAHFDNPARSHVYLQHVCASNEAPWRKNKPSSRTPPSRTSPSRTSSSRTTSSRTRTSFRAWTRTRALSSFLSKAPNLGNTLEFVI
ncbi:unnamed protein product [Cylicocyclus nassatus]|uniref:Uncharacterized protein n=1 Tax=Cylicocyclus nassatus TaxID=53992 RepID=A0AA36GSI8_CYLNA|nr:unnamed protein product [Cylicocyclus nassatus]